MDKEKCCWQSLNSSLEDVVKGFSGIIEIDSCEDYSLVMMYGDLICIDFRWRKINGHICSDGSSSEGGLRTPNIIRHSGMCMMGKL